MARHLAGIRAGNTGLRGPPYEFEDQFFATVSLDSGLYRSIAPWM